jgi:hypothetical protein
MVKIVNFSMDESLYKVFRTQARRDDKPMSEIVRQLIAEHYLTTQQVAEVRFVRDAVATNE